MMRLEYWRSDQERALDHWAVPAVDVAPGQEGSPEAELSLAHDGVVTAGQQR